MKQWRQSMTFRLNFLFTLVTAVLLVGFGLIALALTNDHFKDLDESYLKNKATLIQEISQHTGSTRYLAERVESILGTQSGLNVALSTPTSVLFVSPGFVLDPDTKSLLQTSPPGTIVQWTSGQQRLRGLLVSIPTPSAPESSPMTAVLAIDTEHHDHFMQTFRTWLWIYLVIAIGLGALLSFWVAHKGLAPLRLIIAKARNITASQLSARIPTKDTPSELAALATSLNTMFERLEQDFERLSDFSTDLAHELRTPISNMLVQAQVTLGKTREIHDYQETLHSLVEELERLSSMVSDMLYLAKTENSLELPQRAPVALDVEALQLVEFYQLMADEKNITLTVQGHAQITGDRLMVRRVLSNLLSNAIRHALPDTNVLVNIEVNDSSSQVTVCNQGQAIPLEIQKRLFDRFFRGDAARSHPASEGSGLGLAITKAVMLAHGGSILVESVGGQTTFHLVFPKAP